MAGVSEKMVSVATASFLCGILKAGNLDLKCILMGYLVDVTAHEWSSQSLLDGVRISPTKIRL